MATEGSEEKSIRRMLLVTFIMGLFIGMALFLMVHYLFTYEFVCIKGEQFITLLERAGYL